METGQSFFLFQSSRGVLCRLRNVWSHLLKRCKSSRPSTNCLELGGSKCGADTDRVTIPSDSTDKLPVKIISDDIGCWYNDRRCSEARE